MMSESHGAPRRSLFVVGIRANTVLRSLAVQLYGDITVVNTIVPTRDAVRGWVGRGCTHVQTEREVLTL